MEEERDIETQIQLIKNTLHPTQNRPYNPATRLHQPRPAARTFMAFHKDEQGSTTYDNIGAPGSATRQQATDTTGDEDPLTEQHTLLQNWMNGDDWNTFTCCFLSPAENALRNASGTDRPLECWGCTGHATHHVNRFHSFRDCPNKYDPDVRRTAFRRMKQMREEWESRNENKEQQQGHKSERD
ncbi:hypothetical protein MHU86_22421 [Fragilaria crotonensis]|nr:hypothetical protein MHU86_22421 [Fragilaria crotonensis]